jgi:cellulose synthase/poly-beta-1,6-N-acetylglucosamine synthase-like glycosyltransferase
VCLPAAQVIEPTVVAALNIDYPGPKLTVHVLDDGRRPEVITMVNRLRAQCK